MAPKKPSSSATTPPPKSAPSHTKALSSTTPSTPSSKPSSSLSNKSSPQDVALHVWNQYLQNTPSRTLLLDLFMAFLVLVGGIQFLYAIIGGNYVSPNIDNYACGPDAKSKANSSSHSTLSSPASRPQLANSSLRLHYACRRARDRQQVRQLRKRL
jgi:DAD family